MNSSLGVRPLSLLQSIRPEKLKIVASAVAAVVALGWLVVETVPATSCLLGMQSRCYEERIGLLGKYAHAVLFKKLEASACKQWQTYCDRWMSWQKKDPYKRTDDCGNGVLAACFSLATDQIGMFRMRSSNMGRGRHANKPDDPSVMPLAKLRTACEQNSDDCMYLAATFSRENRMEACRIGGGEWCGYALPLFRREELRSRCLRGFQPACVFYLADDK